MKTILVPALVSCYNQEISMINLIVQREKSNFPQMGKRSIYGLINFKKMPTEKYNEDIRNKPFDFTLYFDKRSYIIVHNCFITSYTNTPKNWEFIARIGVPTDGFRKQYGREFDIIAENILEYNDIWGEQKEKSTKIPVVFKIK